MSIHREHGRRTGRNLADEVIGNLKHELGVDILPILLDETLTYGQRRAKAAFLLTQAAVDRADAGEYRAEWGPTAEFDEDAFLRVFAEAEVDIEPNVIYTVNNAKTLSEYQGVDVKDYLYSLTKRFEAASKAQSAGMMALEIAGGAALSVGVPMAVGTFKAIRAGTRGVAAIRAGITSIGMKTAVATIIIVLVGMLLWLILENPKKCLGMVLNCTDDILVVKDWRNGVTGGGNSNLFMNHGDMKSFMQDYEEGDLNKKIQINKRVVFAPDDPENAVYAGMYFADKNAGFFGAEGIMIFNSTTTSLQFAHLFAVPYTNDNGTNIGLVTGTPDPKTLFQTYYDARKVRVTPSGGGFTMTSTVNDARGGTVGCIASIWKV